MFNQLPYRPSAKRWKELQAEARKQKVTEDTVNILAGTHEKCPVCNGKGEFKRELMVGVRFYHFTIQCAQCESTGTIERLIND